MAGTERAKKRVWSEQSLLYGPYVRHLILLIASYQAGCLSFLIEAMRPMQGMLCTI